MKFLRVLRGFHNIQELVDKNDVEGLLEMLNYKRNWAVREEAAKALGQIRDERVVEPLIEALKDEAKTVRNRAAQSLGRIGDGRAVEPLIEALNDEEWMVKRDALWALGMIGDERAVEPLINILQDKSVDGRSGAVGALGKIGDERAIEPLIEALQDTIIHVRQCAAQALGEFGDERAVEPLIEVLKSWPSYKGWEDLGLALVKIGDKRGMEAIRASLKDPKAELRMAAADTLLKIGDLNPGENVKGYFVSEPPDGDGLCSDNKCPCPGMGADIPRGEGYLFIPAVLVGNRKHHRTESEAKALIERDNKRIQSELPGFHGRSMGRQGRYSPVLCCRRGAESRKLDLQTASKDAEFWWETGLVPLRRTPEAK